MSDELKPCPFCGEHAKVYDFKDGRYLVECSNTNCDVYPYTSIHRDKADAIAAWNQRATVYTKPTTLSQLQAENAKLRELCAGLLTGYECGYGELCDGCSWNGLEGDCTARTKARELGVEVDA